MTDYFDIPSRARRGRPGRPDRARHHHGEPADHLDHAAHQLHHAAGDFSGRSGFPGPGFGGFDPRGFGPGPRRRSKGDVRLAILSLLSENDGLNGYSIMKAIGEKTDGAWRASPGSVYPTLQQLVDEELIETVGEGKRTEFQLTEAGRTYATEHAEQLERLWTATEQDATAEAGLHEAIQKLMGVVHQFRFAATDEQRAKAVETLDETRRTLYGILAD